MYFALYIYMRVHIHTHTHTQMQEYYKVLVQFKVFITKFCRRYKLSGKSFMEVKCYSTFNLGTVKSQHGHHHYRCKA